jgi:transcriptional regulator with XRE-family HTH domain
MTTNQPLTFGEFIRRKREAAGVTQDACARAIGWGSRASYHKIETGKLKWKLEDFITVARVIGEEPGKLLSEYLQEADDNPAGPSGKKGDER